MPHREYSADDILRIGRNVLTRVDIARDALPGGLSAAMVPALVDWSASSLDGGADDYYVVKNVNVSTNPVAGTLMLGTARIPADGVERIEWVFVVTKVGRRDSRAGHVQLRFIFREGCEPEVASNEGEPLGRDLAARDLVFSWEAWRPPLVDFDPVAGLDPETYALSLRVSWGPARCLSDSLFDRPWVCYPVRLPEVDGAARDVLDTCLLFGDSVARQTVGSILDERIAAGREAPQGYGDDVGLWKEMAARLEEGTRESPIEEMLGGEFGYHLLQRSCISLALMSLDAANVRIHRRAGLGEPQRVRATPEEKPPLVDHIAEGRRVTALLSIPAALGWLRKNPEIVPANAHDLLDEVGLLVRDGDKLVSEHFDNRKVTPYGRIQDHLIY